MTQHEFKICDGDVSEVIGNELAVLVFGSTGTGKSSLIQLFCGQNVVVGHGAESQTSESTLYKQINGDRYWLDSQGANDSNGADDRKVLTDILKKLYDEKVTNIKIIWCVSGDMIRAKKEFKIQAKFIESLSNDTANAWNSCLIIEKEGKPIPKKMNGILAAIKAQSSKTDIKYGDPRLFGFTALDRINVEDDALLQDFNEMYGDNPNRLKQKYDQWGYFKNDEIMNKVNERLEKLPALKIEFAMEKCSKCGIKGDPRYLYELCHVESEQHHPNLSLVNYHPQGTEKFHHGKWEGVIVDRGGGRPIIDKTKWEKWEYRWSCCKNKDQSNKGCLVRWICCKIEVNKSSGCKRKYSCCNNDEGATGCKTRCTNGSCHKEWGTGPGCTQTTQ